MAQGILSETREEQKYPKWFRYLGMAYVVVFVWTLFAAPAGFSDALIALLLWSPALLGLLYIFEKPRLVAEHQKAARIAFAVLAADAMFWGLVLVYAFMG